MRTAVRTTGWIGLLVTLGLIAALLVLFATHPRSELDYLQSVHLYGNPDQRVPAQDMPSDKLLIGIGDRACAWLGHQQPALWRRDSRFQPGIMATNYVATSSAAAALLFAGLRPQSVVGEAWSHLCPATLELVEPHYRAVGGAGD